MGRIFAAAHLPDRKPLRHTLGMKTPVAARGMAVATALFCLALVHCAQTDSSPPNILIITLDTTRVDRIGFYGSDRETTPHLDRLAAESVIYTDAISPSSWTLPAHASLLTGKFPSSHGARFHPEGAIQLSQLIEGKDGFKRFRANGIGDGVPTLATILSENGYATHAIVAGPWMKSEMGLDIGFDDYDDSNITSLDGRPASDVTDAALRWLGDGSRQPFFLMLNYYDPHGPHKMREGFLGERPPLPPNADPEAHKQQKTLWHYEAEIRFMDHHLGRLIDGLREKTLYEDTWIIVTSDHGELFGEHQRIGHGTSLHQEVVRIPLLLKYPRGKAVAERRDERVQLVDILPTILKELELPVPPDVQGNPLDHLEHPVVAEIYPPRQRFYDGDVQVLFEGPYKLVQKTRGRLELYDLGADPGENENLIESMPERGASMHATLRDYLAGLPPAVPDTRIRQVDPETEEALRGLGYLE